MKNHPLPEKITKNTIFTILTLFIIRWDIKNTHIIIMKVYKRKYRQLSERTKEKIRKSMTGKKKSTLHRKRISESLRTYWEGVKSLPYYNNESDKSSNLDV